MWGPIPAPGILCPTAPITRGSGCQHGPAGHGVAVRVSTEPPQRPPCPKDTLRPSVIRRQWEQGWEGGTGLTPRAGTKAAVQETPKHKRGREQRNPGPRSSSTAPVRQHRGAAPVPTRHGGGVTAPGVFWAARRCIYTTRRGAPVAPQLRVLKLETEKAAPTAPPAPGRRGAVPRDGDDGTEPDRPQRSSTAPFGPMAPQEPNADRRRKGSGVGGERPPAHVAPGGTGCRARSQPSRSHGHGARSGGGRGRESHGVARTPQTAIGRGGGRGDGRTARPRSRRTDNGREPPRPAPYLGVKVAPSAVSAVPAGGGRAALSPTRGRTPPSGPPGSAPLRPRGPAAPRAPAKGTARPPRPRRLPPRGPAPPRSRPPRALPPPPPAPFSPAAPAEGPARPPPSSRRRPTHRAHRPAPRPRPEHRRGRGLRGGGGAARGDCALIGCGENGAGARARPGGGRGGAGCGRGCAEPGAGAGRAGRRAGQRPAARPPRRGEPRATGGGPAPRTALHRASGIRPPAMPRAPRPHPVAQPRPVPARRPHGPGDRPLPGAARSRDRGAALCGRLRDPPAPPDHARPRRGAVPPLGFRRARHQHRTRTAVSRAPLSPLRGGAGGRSISVRCRRPDRPAPPTPQHRRSPGMHPGPLRGALLLVAERHGAARAVQLGRDHLQVRRRAGGGGMRGGNGPVTPPAGPGAASRRCRSGTQRCG